MFAGGRVAGVLLGGGGGGGGGAPRSGCGVLAGTDSAVRLPSCSSCLLAGCDVASTSDMRDSIEGLEG